MAFLWSRIVDAVFYVIPPSFDVDIDTRGTNEYTIAGQLTKICTISIKFPDNYWLNDTRREIDSLRPTIYLTSERSAHSNRTDVDITRGVDNWVSDKEVRFDISLRVTLADTFVAHIKLSRNRVYFVGRNAVRYTVRPAEPRSIELIEQEPLEGHGEGDSTYRGGSVRLFLEIKDEHQNTCKEDLNFNMTQTTGSVTLISTVFNERKCYHVVTVRCDQAGMASFRLSLQTDHQPHLDLQVNVIPPPVSASKSAVPNLDEIQTTDHVAGVPIKVKLVLRDIFGNVVPYEEREKSTKQVDIRIGDKVPISRKQIISTKSLTIKVSKLGQNSNECEIEATPIKAGLQMMSMSIANKNVKDFPIDEITVLSGPLAQIRIIRHDPLVSGNDIVSYPTEKRFAVVKGTDEHGNVVSLDPKKWYLEISGDVLQNPITVDGNTCRDDDSTLKFSYTFERKATYTVTIIPKDASQNHVKVPSFVIKVTRPPIDSERCKANVTREDPIFTGGFRPLELQLLLYDCTNEKYEILDEEIPHLKVKVNCKVCHHSVERGTQPNELFLVLDQITEGGEKGIQVTYEDEDLCYLEAYVVDVIPYDEEEYIELEEDQKIRCVGVSKGFLIGEDYANINNIQRLLDIDHLLDLMNSEARYEVVFDLKGYSSQAFSTVVRLLSLLVKGAHHYRGQARQFDIEREEWKTEATKEYHLGNHRKAKECKAIKEKFGKLMNESNRLASDAIFKFYNDGRHDSEIDLHGQLVADEKKLRDYQRQLLKKNRTSSEVEGIIERERNEGDEAIRLLEDRLTTLRNKETRPSERDWLEIIDGAGHHSKEGQKIRPRVKRFLNEKEYQYIKANKGALLVTFSEYTGQEPCYGNFYCSVCEKAWVSRTTWKGYYQQCHGCDFRKKDSRCYPFMLRSFSYSSKRRRRKGAASIDFTDKDHIRLCQKCQELGMDCRDL